MSATAQDMTARPDDSRLATRAPGVDFAAMMRVAIEQGESGVITLERVMAMYERDRDYAAELEYNAAMSAAQSEMGRVSANADNAQTKSKYADYGQLDAALRPIYTRHHFALSFDTGDIVDDTMPVTCHVSHAGGHSRTHTIPMDCSGKGAKGGDVMTKTHARGSAASYGMRYLLKLIFNVAVGEDDDDGQAAGKAQIEAMSDHIHRLMAQMDVLRDSDNLRAIADVKDGLDPSALADDATVTVEDAARAGASFSHEELMKLNIPPSKGGVFTTKERTDWKSGTEEQHQTFRDLLHVYRTDAGWFDEDGNRP